MQGAKYGQSGRVFVWARFQVVAMINDGRFGRHQRHSDVQLQYVRLGSN